MNPQCLFFNLSILLILCFVCSSKSYDYDLVIIGSGAAGITAAKLAYDRGKRIAIIEKNKPGGSKIWFGDIPTKTFAQAARELKKVNEKSYIKELSYTFDTSSLLSHIRKISNDIYEFCSIEELTKMGIEIIIGTARFIDNHTLTINGRTICTDNVILATGTRPHITHIEGIISVPYLTPETFFTLNVLPKSIIIIGGGFLGVELAETLGILGVNVTIIMKHGLLLPTFDFELVGMLTENLQQLGISVLCSSLATKVENDKDLVKVTYLDRFDMYHTITAESLFVATNRIANIENLGLENTNVTFNKKGIEVKKTMQTNANNIYACGDVVGQTLLSRVAHFQAKIAIQNMFRPWWQKEIKPNYINLARMVYTYPPFASIGLTEQEAYIVHGSSLRIYRCPYTLLDKAHIDGTTEGIAKFICTSDGTIVGAHIFGECAGELIELVKIGHKLYNLETEYIFKQHAVLPNYKELIWHANQLCKKDLEPLVSNKNIIQYDAEKVLSFLSR